MRNPFPNPRSQTPDLRNQSGQRIKGKEGKWARMTELDGREHGQRQKHREQEGKREGKQRNADQAG